MAKFLDKKEQAIDFQLTPYGKYKLAVGKFKPAYYSFYDTNVLYDSEYAGFKETQNNTHKRIKTDTQYLEGILSFEELENSVPPSNLTRTLSIYDDWDTHGSYASASDAVRTAADAAGYEDVDFTDKYLARDKAIKALIEDAASAFLDKMTTTSMFDLDIAPEQHIPRAEFRWKKHPNGSCMENSDVPRGNNKI